MKRVFVVNHWDVEVPPIVVDATELDETNLDSLILAICEGLKIRMVQAFKDAQTAHTSAQFCSAKELLDGEQGSLHAVAYDGDEELLAEISYGLQIIEVGQPVSLDIVNQIVNSIPTEGNNS